ncbi:MAG: hypothetical protein WCW01_01915 [Gammaproteobacteria bacterium]
MTFQLFTNKPAKAKLSDQNAEKVAWTGSQSTPPYNYGTCTISSEMPKLSPPQKPSSTQSTSKPGSHF